MRTTLFKPFCYWLRALLRLRAIALALRVALALLDGFALSGSHSLRSCAAAHGTAVRASLMLAVASLSIAGLMQRVGAQQNPNDAIYVLPVHGPIYMLAGAGANITASVGLDGVLLVDAGTAEMSEAVLTTIRGLQNQLATSGVKPAGFAPETRSSMEAMLATPAPAKPIRYIVNTHADADHIGGNATLRRAGMTITGGNVAGSIADSDVGALVYAHENMLMRMSNPPGGQEPAPSGAMPTDTYISEYFKLPYFNGEGIQLFHMPAAHSDGDTLVWFRGSDVIATGDLFSTTTYPVIDVDKGGNIQGIIDALNFILDLAFAEFRTEGGTMIVPGHGRLSDSADVAYYRDMVTIIRDRIQDMINEGMTLEQVKAARPTLDYDPLYGQTTGVWTTDRFVEAVYKSLSRKQ